MSLPSEVLVVVVVSDVVLDVLMAEVPEVMDDVIPEVVSKGGAILRLAPNSLSTPPPCPIPTRHRSGVFAPTDRHCVACDAARIAADSSSALRSS